MVTIREGFKPSDAQLARLKQRAIDEGRSPQEIYEAFVRKGWIDRDEELEKSFAEEASTSNPGPEGETINEAEGEEEAPVDFISQAKGEDWDNNTGQEKLKIFADEYNNILKEAAAHVNKYAHGEGLVGKGKENFNKTLDEYKKKLEELEQSPEFKQLMKDIAEGGTGKLFDNGIMNADINQTLKMATAGLGSKMFNDKDRAGNYLSEFATSGPAKFMNELASGSQGGNWGSLLGALPAAAYSIFAGEDAQDIAKEYLKNNKGAKGTSSDEESKWNKLREKNANVDINKATDQMAFGEDAASSGIEGYVENRDSKLATLLKIKGIESPEEIDKFLSQYPSWKGAKQEWKDATLKRLSEKVSNVKYDDVAKQVKDVKSKKEDKTDKTDKTDKKNKDVYDKDSWVWKTDENGYWNPDNESPINGVEESDKGGKGSVSEHEEQTPENNKYLHINEVVKNIKSRKDRIDYLKKHGFTVDKKTGFFTKNGMKTKFYKDGQYNPEWVKPDKKEGYNDRTLVEPSKQDNFQIALQKSGYKGPRDANGNFLPITDEWLDLQEAKKKESKTKK